MQIGDRTVGDGEKAFIIAEVGLSHEGSLGLAHSYIDAIAATGADAVKFQTHLPEAESTVDELFRVPFSYEDKTRWDYWSRTGFDAEGWQGLADHCKEKDILFLSSPFSVQAVELLDNLAMPAFKVASGNLTNPEILQSMVKTGKPLIFSSGLSSWEDLRKIAQFCSDYKIDGALMQCTSRYPSPLQKVGLNIISDIENELGLISGISDHSGTVFPALASMALGHALIEVHAVFDRGMFGPDVKASLTMSELTHLTEARDAFQLMRQPVNKNAAADKMDKMKDLFGWSLALKNDLPAGTVIEETDLCLKKPGTGLDYTKSTNLIGKTLSVDVPSNRLLKMEDF